MLIQMKPQDGMELTFLMKVKWDTLNGKGFGSLREYSTEGITSLVSSNSIERLNILDDAIHLSVPLGPMGFPSKYKVMFYAREIINTTTALPIQGYPIEGYHTRGIVVEHVSNWIDIPPPTFTLSTLNPIVLRPGEQTVAIADLESNVASKTILELIPKDIGLKVSVYSIDPPTFKVAVPENMHPAIYKIPISAKLGEQSAVPLNSTLYHYAPIISFPVAKGTYPCRSQFNNNRATAVKFSRTV